MASDCSEAGIPVLVSEAGSRTLERVALMPVGSGAFDEGWLQRLVHNHPACLPIQEIEPSLNPFTAICREMPTPRGPLDNLLMTGAGDICIVETKLFRNPEARRKIVAQVLDYATGLFALGYEAFEKAALAGSFAPYPKPSSLFDALPKAGKLDEAAFVDAVSRNLQRGRVLILLAGDGIRTETMALLDGLHAHARFGFTFALVELGVFRMPGSDAYLVRPRTLMKTAIVQRTVVEVVGGTALIEERRVVVPETLGADKYWHALESNVPGARAALERLLAAAEPLEVFPELLGTLNLKWQRADKKPVNLGYIYKHGALWTDAAAWFAPRHLAQQYVQKLAAAFSCDVHEMPSSGNWTLYQYSKPLRLGAVMDQLDAWLPIMEDFIQSIAQHDIAD